MPLFQLETMKREINNFFSFACLSILCNVETSLSYVNLVQQKLFVTDLVLGLEPPEAGLLAEV